MKYWRVREELSRSDKLRRSYYELLRDDLDRFMLQYALVDSYRNFLEKRLPYPFVEKRELKPRARIPDFEYRDQNTSFSSSKTPFRSHIRSTSVSSR